MPQYEITPERERVLQRHPDYAVVLQPSSTRVQARVGATVVADSSRALSVEESFHPAVTYFPLEDVDTSLLRATSHRTRCPFKGDANYYSIVTEDSELADAVWEYAEPMDEVVGLRGHVAFYTDRVEIVPA